MTASSVPADTALGADPAFPTFRFGNPFFLAPNVDELVKRFQVKDNLSMEFLLDKVAVLHS